MPTKAQSFAQLAEYTAEHLTSSLANWTGFLTTVGRLYKYPYHEQLMIYAQRPDATACADYELWNNKMNRFVRRGSTGIALLDSTGDKPRLKYVFDVSDTGGRENSRRPFLWEMQDHHNEPILEMLADKFDVKESSLFEAFDILARNLSKEYYEDHREDIRYLAENSFLEEYDEDNLQSAFVDAAAVSTAYTLMKRCGLETEEYFSHEDFLPIFDFNTADAVCLLGTAVSEQSEKVFRQIAITITKTERERSSEHEQHHLSEERGLSDTKPEHSLTGTATRQIWEDAQNLPSGASVSFVQLPDPERETLSPSVGDRPNSNQTDGTDYNRSTENAGTSRQDDPSDGMGGIHEQLEIAGRGTDTGGANLQLTLFPTEEEQIQRIAESKMPSAFSLSLAEIEHELLRGTGTQNGKFRVHQLYQAMPDRKTAIDFLKQEYGFYGHSHTFTDGTSGFVDYQPSRGMVIQHYHSNNKVALKWEDVEKHLRALVMADRYLTAEEKAELESREKTSAGLDTELDTALQEHELVQLLPIPYAPGDTVYLENNTAFIIEKVGQYDVTLRDPSLFYPILRAESRESFLQLLERYPQPETGHEKGENFRITDEHLGEGSKREKFQRNLAAITTLQTLEKENRPATKAEQEILSKYIGWGGLSEVFDKDNNSFSAEYAQLKASLSEDEYDMARASTLNAHYTSPTVIKAIYNTVERMGFSTGNILEPACGIGNFFGLLPDNMTDSRLYGIELDSITGRIAKQLYPNANIAITGFEKAELPDSFFDLAIGNVPFGNYKLSEKRYDSQGFLIHDHFFAKALDKVRPGGVVAFITSKGTMDKQSPEVRRYLAQRAELLGAVRLPNNAFLKNAGTEVTSDILFLQKRDRPIDVDRDWIYLDKNENDITLNRYFADHPEMILGKMEMKSGQFGMESTCTPVPDADLSELLMTAMANIEGNIPEAELPDLEIGTSTTLPADPAVKNFSYTLVDGEVYYRENSRMVRPELNQTAKERIAGLVNLRECVNDLIRYQLEDYGDDTIKQEQAHLNQLYDSFTSNYGLINSRGNSLAFSEDNSYYLLCSLEDVDENGNLKAKADMFTKRTIKKRAAITSVDTASEALAVSIGEKATVDMAYMAKLTGLPEEQLAEELTGVVFRLPDLQNEEKPAYVTADEYLSGNVREKLRTAKLAARLSDIYLPNVSALEAAQPKDLEASEIDVRLGATWVDKGYIEQFMYDLFDTPWRHQGDIEVKYAPFTAEWSITNKNSIGYNNVAAYVTYGTDRANAYRILEDTLNLRDIRIYDTVTDPDGKERRVLNKDATTLAQQKQQTIKDAFQEWIFKDADRRQTLVRQYNEKFNSIRPREYDGQHIKFGGINPEIALRPHQVNAIAHILYGNNTLLAHEVGAGKTFEMVAAAMESKRLGLCQKPLFAVPNHLTEQWASEFLRLYPASNILVATKKDFETRNRKKFCARIATGEYDAVIIGHSQFERIPMSIERQERLLREQIDEIIDGIEEIKASGGERFTVKQLERTKKGLEERLKKLEAQERKDDVVTFEQLGVDRLYVDEAHSYKNLFLYTKMRNVAGLSTSDAQKSSDMFLKCRYMDELTGGKGIVFATGTPISNSMTELYTMQRYLQYNTLQKNGLTHFDCWASTFGETVTAIELAPEGTGYRARTRFSKFFNLPELMSMFKEVADIKTADQLDLPTPKVIYETVAVKPTEIQSDMVKELSKRAAEVHANKVDPSVDNMLKITSDGRKLGLDQRIINPLLPDDEASKVNACVNNIYRIWQEGSADKLTQLVFCDISTPKGRAMSQDERAAKAGSQTINGIKLAALEDTLADCVAETGTIGFNVYDDIRSKLVSMGMPQHQVAFIHEANTEVRKKELFAKVRSGDVRVLLGSTAKCGAGTNIQDRLVALHDLDCPWRPGDLTQRSGRIERQGNLNEEVGIYRYVTEATFDAYLWQTVENKQKFISQIMTSKSPVRSCEDVDEAALSYAEIKALCAGNPKIKEKMDLDIDVARLKLLKSNHQSSQYRLEDNLLKYFPENIERNKGYIKGFEQDLQTLKAHIPKDGEFMPMVIKSDTLTDKDNAGAALLEACKEVKGSESVEIGSYRGFSMHLSFDSFNREFQLTLKGAISHPAKLGMDARGNLIRIDNALAAMPERLKAVTNQLDNLYNQQAAAKAELGKPFPQEQELKEKTVRLSTLDAELNMDAGGHAPSSDALCKKDRPSILESLKQPPKVGKELKVKHEKEMEAR
jgi:N12 class adenine-specific DNA methylase/adenine-specific DNA methylase